ncbi:MAG TPA: hypothetical protein VGP85_17015 [Pyrinomonadaceae bacterium]|jgi:hypothetical protein|nr:hypothetical protein [Pyrinomonadaceae bacterium]
MYLQLRTRLGKEKGRRSRFQQPSSYPFPTLDNLRNFLFLGGFSAEHASFSLKLLREAPNGETLTHKHEYETTQDDSEIRQVLAEAAKSFIATIEFYKSKPGGGKSHDAALEETLKCHEWRRSYIDGLKVEEINWGQLAAVAEVNTDDCFKLWSRMRKAADDELQSGKRGARIAGDNSSPFAFAQYLAIRDSFADQLRDIDFSLSVMLAEVNRGKRGIHYGLRPGLPRQRVDDARTHIIRRVNEFCRAQGIDREIVGIS